MKVLIVCLLVALTFSCCLSACLENADCAAQECCAHTPVGSRICMKYHQLGEQCRFTHRTPSCGCAAGLLCQVKEGRGDCVKAA